MPKVYFKIILDDLIWNLRVKFLITELIRQISIIKVIKSLKWSDTGYFLTKMLSKSVFSNTAIYLFELTI
jgi:hypothetical protein